MADDIVQQLALGVGSSVISGTAVWLAQRFRASSRIQTRRRFLGLAGRQQGRARIVVGRHPALDYSVHQYDMAAALEVGGLLRKAGAEAEFLSPGEAMSAGTADTLEFCVSGPEANERTGAHLRRFLPGATMLPYRRDDPDSLAIVIGERRYLKENGRAEYALLARIDRPGRPKLFLIVGQTAIANRAAAGFLSRHLPELRRRFGDDGSFCLVVKAVEPRAFGHHEVEEVAEVTDAW